MLPWLLLACVPTPGVPGAAEADGLPKVDGVAYYTVQAAIDAAPEHGWVSVPAGRFEESIVISRDVTVEGAGGDETILVGEGGTVVRIEAKASVTLRGLEITGGEGDPAGSDTRGGGVWVEGTLVGVELEVRANAAGDAGGGIYVLGADSRVHLEASAVTGNTAHFGAGIFVADAFLVDLVDTDVSFNDADDRGGWYDDSAAIDFWGSRLYLTGGSRVEHNEGGCGGLNLGDGDTVVRDAVINDNTGEQADGACLDPYEGTSPRLTSMGSDWGAGDAGRDVYFAGVHHAYGAGASFSCDADVPDGCR